MATDRARRRLLLGAGLGWLGAVPAGAASRRQVLAAAWQDGSRHVIGLLAPKAGTLQPVAQLEVPTRAHGLAWVPDGAGAHRLLAVARRPGDWFVSWRPGAGPARWHWARPGTVFNGHAVWAPGENGRSRILVTQTDVETGAGEVGVFDARTLEPIDAWPTLGRDPHDLLLHDGSLWVANGGIDTRPETGRAKRELDRMDSSLVAMDLRNGRVHGQWRVPDQRLSLRHLAANGPAIGIALQAEHDDATARARAPLLAVWGRGELALPPPAEDTETGGYGGDIAAWRDGFVVTATRAARAWAWSRSSHPGGSESGSAGGSWSAWPVAQAGAAATDATGLWVGGSEAVLRVDPAGVGSWRRPTALRLDNHWLALDSDPLRSPAPVR